MKHYTVIDDRIYPDCRRMYREDITRFMISKLIETEQLYDFPQFLYQARIAYGISRKTVSQETNISHTRLYYLETGFFKKVNENACLILGNYYGIPVELLKNKAKKYVEEHKNRWKGMPCHY